MRLFKPFAFHLFPFCKGAFVMRSSVILTVAILVAAMAAQAGAALVDVGLTGDVAKSGTVTTTGDLGSIPAYPQFSSAHLIDGKVSNLADLGANDNEATSCIFNDGSDQAATVTWTQTQNLTSLQAYVVSGIGAGTWDRTVSAVTFSIDQGAGFTAVGTVDTADTNEVGAFDLVKLDGNWSNVTAVKYTFTPATTGSNGPRVADVLAIGAVPEPSSVVLLCAGLLSLLAYAWRSRK
jgi:hypothetical protein